MPPEAHPPLESLPLGVRATVPGAGSMFYRYLPGPVATPDPPTVVLLHGWTSTADVTWHGVYGPLSRHYRVVAPDMRGHGLGPRGRRRARLADAAADVVGLMEALDLGPALLVGYSMGGVVAQIVARNRPELLSGLVVCASASSVCEPHTGWFASAALRVASLLSSAVPDGPLNVLISAVMRLAFGDSEFERWARSRTARHRWSEVLSLGADLVRFDSRPWVADLAVSSSVVVTAADRLVAPHRQHLLATSLDAPAVCVDGDHSICLARSTVFADALVRACRSVLRHRDGLPAPASEAAHLSATA